METDLHTARERVTSNQIYMKIKHSNSAAPFAAALYLDEIFEWSLLEAVSDKNFRIALCFVRVSF